jgi:hypothetical protein
MDKKMERLTIITCDGDICYAVESDPEGAYDILDLAKEVYDGDEEEALILLEISKRLAHYEDAEKKRTWVSVKERLPKSGDTVLAYIKHNYSDTDGWRAYRVYEYTDHWVTMGNLCEVIAWMLLPDAPKE